MYYDKDADLKLIKTKTVAIIGFGSQGHAHAQNLRDSGVTVVVSDLPGTPNAKRAKKAGFEVVSRRRGDQGAPTSSSCSCPTTSGRLYKNDVAPNLKAGTTLMFAHGFNIHFGQIVPPKTSTSPWSPPRAPATSCAASTKRARACRR